MSLRLKGPLQSTKYDLLEALQNSNIETAIINYSGSGDSGDIDDVILYVGGKQTSQKTRLDLRQRLSEFTSEVLSHLGIDWYNNEGGSSSLTFDAKEEKVTLNHTEYYTSENCSEYKI